MRICGGQLNRRWGNDQWCNFCFILVGKHWWIFVCLGLHTLKTLLPQFYLIYTLSTKNSLETYLWASTHRLRTTALVDCIWSLILQTLLLYHEEHVTQETSGWSNHLENSESVKQRLRAGLMKNVAFWLIKRLTHHFLSLCVHLQCAYELSRQFES